ncbi:Holliday junction resolvase RuvX [Blochmannia endosymbiont of Camponotus sp. C-003]|uniref:Holliday junction resolvase RuvX n=1 Tax=unclassified Candidatus Blochmanniella TaxID=711328 RepID=UPI002024FAF0|nr:MULTISPECIES: Holliday junction resolvase RuvX [unclassified Candidatus Blochmannia]URJ23556.1 Holliday junction resolvase RuvX [Blochmannia endosymbiont of Camponotus sp. C-003]URJ29027.1 Holliday junction resolvase RuvX [Blochmannia endosymbiont of Camponotus sp. C-046]
MSIGGVDIVMGFDFGTEHIGVAIGQTLTYTAQPLTVLRSESGVPNWKHIKNIYNTWKPTIAVVGLPLKIDGSEQPITILAKIFAMQLKEQLPVTVKMHDERFSTSEARLNYSEYCCNYLCVKPNININALSAGVILESWLNQS